jgi:hypothetical protein
MWEPGNRAYILLVFSFSRVMKEKGRNPEPHKLYSFFERRWIPDAVGFGFILNLVLDKNI